MSRCLNLVMGVRAGRKSPGERCYLPRFHKGRCMGFARVERLVLDEMEKAVRAGALAIAADALRALDVLRASRRAEIEAQTSRGTP